MIIKNDPLNSQSTGRSSSLYRSGVARMKGKKVHAGTAGSKDGSSLTNSTDQLKMLSGRYSSASGDMTTTPTDSQQLAGDKSAQSTPSGRKSGGSR